MSTLNSQQNKLQQNPFNSFWMGGFECSDKLNAFGNRVDLLNITGHLHLLEEDYEMLLPFNIKTVREGIRWSQVEKRAFHYDWSAVEKMINAAKAKGIQQVWDLCHFGFPDDLTPLHPKFAQRFAALCRSFVKFYRSLQPHGQLIISPINEVSFLSWLGGDARGTSPYCINLGWEVKYSLMRAYIEGINALREEDPSIKILTTEPLIQVVPAINATVEEIEKAYQTEQFQFQCTDILIGQMCPELGGKPDYLDIIGVNFYYNNRWVDGFKEFLSWANIPFDNRWKPLSTLLQQVYERYNRPIIIAETSHPGIHRPNWMNYITAECVTALERNIPLLGVCLYPIIDRPDWDHLTPWHQAGLWDAEIKPGELPTRDLYKPYADALLQSDKLISSLLYKKQEHSFTTV